MNILYLLVPVALMLAGLGIWGFMWAVKSGQYDDTQTPAMRVLTDDIETTSYRDSDEEHS